MGKLIDLTGQRFGRLLVLGRAEKPLHLKPQGAFWLCKCDCDNKEVIIDGNSLRKGQTKSCGCIHDEYVFKNKYKDLTGKRFGKLTVLELDHKRKQGKRVYIYWKCVCDCNPKKMIIKEGTNLKDGNTLSCGCLWKEKFGLVAFNNLLCGYKNHAKRRKINFKLTKEEFRNLTKQNCFYCGIEPYQIIKSRNNNGDYIYNGIDRIDSSKDYMIDNVVPCCGSCNLAKKEMSQKEFFSWVNKIYNYLLANRLDNL